VPAGAAALPEDALSEPSEDNWVEDADRALAGQNVEGVTVLRGVKPSLLDGESVRALIAPFIAAIIWSGAIFRELLAGSSIDPLALGLRILALGFTLRVLVLGAKVMERLRVWLEAHRYALVLCEEGLVYRTPRVDVAIPRTSVIGIMAEGSWQQRSKSAHVYVVVDPGLGRTHLALPPIFDATPGRLTERLQRWRGAIEAPETFEHPPPDESANRTYDAAAAGRGPPGTAIVKHGRAWMKTGPYLAVLAAIAVADGLLRGGSSVWQAIEPWVGGGLVVGILAIFARWYWMERRDVAPQKGLSFVLTPSEILMKQRMGMIRVRWADIASVSATSKRTWSVLEGAHDARQLVITRRGASVIRYQEAYLGIPVEVAQVLMDAYKAGVLPPGAVTAAASESAHA
jgi:hypothetical protein